LGKLSKSLDAVENSFAFIGGILLVFNTLTVVMEVLFRYIFNISFVWVMEINEYILLYIPFLGAAWLLRINGHITVDLLSDILNLKLKKFFDIIITSIGVIVSAVLIIYGTLETIELLLLDRRSQTILEFPLVLVTCIIPLGSFVLLLEFIRKFYRIITNYEEKEVNDFDINESF